MDGFVLLATDEGSSIVESMGRYSNQSGADLSPYLKAFDGTRDDVARRGENSYGGELKAALDLSVQPSVLDRVVGDEEMRTRGFINRFCMLVTPTTAGTLDYKKRPITDNDIENRWARLLGHLNETIKGNLMEFTVKLSNEADTIHSEYANAYQERVKPNGDLVEMKDLFSRRHPALVLRYAALYHMAGGYDVEMPINAQTMQYAMATGELFAKHYIAVVSNAIASEGESKIKGLLLKMVKAGLDKISVRDLQYKHWAGIKTPDDATQALDELVDTGWARLMPAIQGKGRKKSPVYELHPETEKYLKGGGLKYHKCLNSPIQVRWEVVLTRGSKNKTVSADAPKVGELGEDGKIVKAPLPANEDDFFACVGELDSEGGFTVGGGKS